MEIHKLAGDVVDKIAAGEVVDRPAHMVKELVENALDAGATKIDLSIDEGGKSISLRDNGTGVYADDLKKVFLRHATSKISSSDDLWQLTTFGFRGEALASIGSVSRMSMKSRRAGSEDSFQIHCDFGDVAEVLPTSTSVGTVVEVKDLFGNIPARKKFLKSDSAETTQIKNVIKAMALSHPGVEWKVKINGRLVHVWPKAEGLLQRAQQVLEQKKMYSHRGHHDNFQVEVAFCDPGTTARVSRQIWLFVQDRWVQDRGLQAAVMESYRNLLMHGEYPYCVVKLSTDPEQVDVNIHPTKSQIKFLKQKEAFRAVHYVLREALEEAPWLEIPKVERPQAQDLTSIEAPAETMSFSDTSFTTTKYKTKGSLESPSAPIAPTKASSIIFSRPTLPQEPKVQNPSMAEWRNVGNKTQQRKWGELQVLGQLNLTYIIAQDSESLWLIDQHAAHERVVFEQLMQGWRDKQLEEQGYLIPLTVDLEESEVEALVEASDELARMGVRLERSGPSTVSLMSAPGMISESGLVKAVEKMAAELSQQGGSFAMEKIVSDIFATMSCHSVVRAGQALSAEEMKKLLQDMDGFPLSGYCPHGRSVSVEKPFYGLEKEFGRRG